MPSNYDDWQRHWEYWVDEYLRRRTTTACYGIQKVVLASISASGPAKILEFGCGLVGISRTLPRSATLRVMDWTKARQGRR